MQQFVCASCGRQAELALMGGWVQQWCASKVQHLCPRCRQDAPQLPGAVRREFFIDQHHLMRTRALRPHHHVVPPAAA